MITFESNWKKAKKILSEIAQTYCNTEQAKEELRQTTQKYLIYYGKLTPIVYTTTRESGILLTIRYLCKSHTRRSTEADIWEAILNTFAAEPNINLAYITHRRVSLDKITTLTEEDEE